MIDGVRAPGGPHTPRDPDRAPWRARLWELLRLDRMRRSDDGTVVTKGTTDAQQRTAPTERTDP